MITIVDYGVGNVASLANMFEHVGAESRLCGAADMVAESDHLVLPGVGAFGHAMSILRSRGLDRAIRAAVDDGALLLGVCLGMQLLARSSEEGDTTGLGLIDADVKRIVPSHPGVKIPNMGWREIRPVRDSWLAPRSENPERFYFAHSFHVLCDRADDVVATVDYDGQKTIAVANGTVHGVQFHPEKSHHFGLRLLSDFARRCETSNVKKV